MICGPFLDSLCIFLGTLWTHLSVKTMWHRFIRRDFPFERQILQLRLFVWTGKGRGWVVSEEAKPWVDTGYGTDVRVQPAAACLPACMRARNIWSHELWSQCFL